MALMLIGLATRLYAIRQPIVENYVGRQIPTAMVARNLDRGSGFLRPQLDIAPFPNLFLVEPPIYASAVVGWKRLSGMALGPSGRLVSALGILLGAWGLFGLVARRDGARTGLVSVAVFLAFPVTIRYGRAFQPDALMLGCLIAGLDAWDRFEVGHGKIWLVLGVFGLATGLALKVISAYVLIPLVFGIFRGKTAWKLLLAGGLLMPALLWYAHAHQLMANAAGSRASADNSTVWLRVFVPWALLAPQTYLNIVKFFGVRAFTPFGPILALLGWLGFATREAPSRLWTLWGCSAFATMLVLAAKLHHEYYWLALAPVIAALMGRFLVGLTDRGRTRAESWSLEMAVAVGFLFGMTALFLSLPTFETPLEWRHLDEAADLIRKVPVDGLLVAPEALLYAADRKGCRLEFTAGAARRAAGEWDDPTGAARVDSPLELVEFYRRHGASQFADIDALAFSSISERRSLQAELSRRYMVIGDQKYVFLMVDLLRHPDSPSSLPNKDVSHGTGPQADDEER